jgi:hypothetical protein
MWDFFEKKTKLPGVTRCVVLTIRLRAAESSNSAVVTKGRRRYKRILDGTDPP